PEGFAGNIERGNMPIAGNPKKLAQDVANGFQQFTQASLRPYTLEDLKVLLFNLNFVLRELRGKQIPLEDIEGLKDKNNRIHRINQAINIIQSFAATKGLKV
ncbi:MAG TPA: hypothetical protein VEL68_11820, partial [Thermodesulfobacteriota bacterium]|nr:hypothetical protein [Thermodesulfobacteriota bacterium]